jgi:hypothetical protein
MDGSTVTLRGSTGPSSLAIVRAMLRAPLSAWRSTTPEPGVRFTPTETRL